MYGIFVTCLTLCWAFHRDGFLGFSQTGPCLFYGRKSFLLSNGTAWEVGKSGWSPLAELKPVSAGSAKPMPACHCFCPVFPTPPCPVQLYTPTPTQIPEPSAGVPLPCLLICCSYDRIGSLFAKGFCLPLGYVTCFCPSSVVTSEPALFYCCISAQNKGLRYFL